MKVKITSEDQDCRNCGGTLKRVEHKQGWKPKRRQPFWFRWWFQCTNPECKSVFMVEEAKTWAEWAK